MKRVIKTLLVLSLSALLITSCEAVDPGSGNPSGSAGPAASETGSDFQQHARPETESGYRKIDDVMDKGPVHGGELRLFSTIPDTLNPIFTKNSYVQNFLGLVYEGLTKLNVKQEPVPVLSDKWTVSQDGLVWNFHMRSGVQWQDGTPFTSEDVEFTINTILNTNNDTVYKTLLQEVATFSAVDMENFRIVLRAPNSFLAEQMYFPILPKHQFHENAANGKETDFKPVGTGPYSFSTYTANKSVRLAANKSWWYLRTVEKPGDYLYVDTIGVMLYTSEKDSINAFQTGDVDVCAINAEDIGKYNGRTDLIIRRYSSRNFEFLACNLSGPVTGDSSARTAIAAALDRKKIISDIFGGCAREADIPVSPDHWFFDGMKSVSEATASPAAILEAGGWKRGDQAYYKSINGVRKELKLEILVANGNAKRIKLAGEICSQLQSAGIPATVVQLDWAQMFQKIDTRKFDIAVMGLQTGRTPDISFLYSGNADTALKSSNADFARDIAGYNNSQVNTYLQQIQTESGNDLKKAHFTNMKQLLDAELPYLGICFTDEAMIYRKNVRGRLEPNTWDKYYDITKWYIPGPQ